MSVLEGGCTESMNWHCLYSAIVRHWSEIVSLLGMLVAGVSLWLSYRTYVRTGRYERFQHATRLQVSDEKTHQYSPEVRLKTGKGWDYISEITNVGMQPVEIRRVFIDYGSRYDPKKRVRHVVKERFYLRPGEGRKIEFSLPSSDVENTMLKFDGQCMFFLRVAYRTPMGQIAEVPRFLGGYEDDTIMISVKGGDALT